MVSNSMKQHNVFAPTPNQRALSISTMESIFERSIEQEQFITHEERVKEFMVGFKVFSFQQASVVDHVSGDCVA